MKYQFLLYTATIILGLQGRGVAATKAETATSVFAVYQDKEVIKLENLPQPVKNTLSADLFKLWKPIKAWKVIDQTTYYLIEVKNGEKAKTVKISEGGKVIQ